MPQSRVHAGKQSSARINAARHRASRGKRMHHSHTVADNSGNKVMTTAASLWDSSVVFKSAKFTSETTPQQAFNGEGTFFDVKITGSALDTINNAWLLYDVTNNGTDGYIPLPTPLHFDYVTTLPDGNQETNRMNGMHSYIETCSNLSDKQKATLSPLTAMSPFPTQCGQLSGTPSNCTWLGLSAGVDAPAGAGFTGGQEAFVGVGAANSAFDEDTAVIQEPGQLRTFMLDLSNQPLIKAKLFTGTLKTRPTFRFYPGNRPVVQYYGINYDNQGTIKSSPARVLPNDLNTVKMSLSNIRTLLHGQVFSPLLYKTHKDAHEASDAITRVNCHSTQKLKVTFNNGVPSADQSLTALNGLQTHLYITAVEEGAQREQSFDSGNLRAIGRGNIVNVGTNTGASTNPPIQQDTKMLTLSNLTVLDSGNKPIGNNNEEGNMTRRLLPGTKMQGGIFSEKNIHLVSFCGNPVYTNQTGADSGAVFFDSNNTLQLQCDQVSQDPAITSKTTDVFVYANGVAEITQTKDGLVTWVKH